MATCSSCFRQSFDRIFFAARWLYVSALVCAAVACSCLSSLMAGRSAIASSTLSMLSAFACLFNSVFVVLVRHWSPKPLCRAAWPTSTLPPRAAPMSSRALVRAVFTKLVVSAWMPCDTLACAAEMTCFINSSAWRSPARSLLLSLCRHPSLLRRLMSSRSSRFVFDVVVPFILDLVACHVANGQAFWAERLGRREVAGVVLRYVKNSAAHSTSAKNRSAVWLGPSGWTTAAVLFSQNSHVASTD